MTRLTSHKLHSGRMPRYERQRKEGKRCDVVPPQPLTRQPTAPVSILNLLPPATFGARASIEFMRYYGVLPTSLSGFFHPLSAFGFLAVFYGLTQVKLR